MKVVKIAIDGESHTLPLDDLTPFQGKLKELSQENYAKLKKEILELGISAPVLVWYDKDTDKDYILDGHQRCRVLKTMRKEGYKIPRIPIIYIQAKDKRQAKRKVLALTSQYGEITKDGLYEFITENDISVDEIEESFRFPEIDLEKFGDEFFNEPSPPEETSDDDQLRCKTCGKYMNRPE